MKSNLAYPEALGLLQARSLIAATMIESIVKVFPLDAWAKAELLKTAKSLRDAEHAAEALCEAYEIGDVRA